jgi:hypothetical protein
VHPPPIAVRRARGTARVAVFAAVTTQERLTVADRRAALAPWPVEATIQLLVFVAYYLTQGHSLGGAGAANKHGHAIWRWENAHLLAPEPVLNALLSQLTPLAVAAGYCYATLHFVVTPMVLIWTYRTHADSYRTARTAFVAATLLGLCCFYVYPTTPPRLLAGTGITDTLAQVHQWGWWGAQNSAPHGMQGLANELAAMPSLHVAWAVWAGFLLARHAGSRVVRIAGGAYPVVISVDVMATGNHYLLDVVGGVAVIAVTAALATAWRRGRVAPVRPARA